MRFIGAVALVFLGAAWARTTRFLVNARANLQPEIEERPAYDRG
jgi:hypothetical protein